MILYCVKLKIFAHNLSLSISVVFMTKTVLLVVQILTNAKDPTVAV